MSLGDFLFGKKEKMQQFSTMNPQQQGLLSQLLGSLGGQGGQGGAFGMGMGHLQRLLGGDVGEFEAPAMRQFQEQIVPGIAERFTGMGAGAQQSSAFGQQLGAAGAGLSERLAAMRGGLQQQAMSQLSQLLGMGMGARPFENVMRPATSGLFGAMAPGIGQGIGMGASSGLMSLLGML